MVITLEGESRELNGGLRRRSQSARQNVLLELEEQLVPRDLLPQVSRVTGVELDGEPEPDPGEACNERVETQWLAYRMSAGVNCRKHLTARRLRITRNSPDEMFQSFSFFKISRVGTSSASPWNSVYWNQVKLWTLCRYKVRN